ncbi:MAG: hypothetical protein Kow0042_06070 [Calditrichia bacterium]
MPIKKLAEDIFHYSENFIYFFIGAFLIIISLFLVYNIITSFFHLSEASAFVNWIVEIIDKILLMLMVIEILYTVRVSFRSHSLQAEPFLIVGLIAAIRRILVISVESAYLQDRFTRHMIEMGILGVLIFIFVVSIILLRRMPEKETPGAEQ